MGRSPRESSPIGHSDLSHGDQRQHAAQTIAGTGLSDVPDRRGGNIFTPHGDVYSGDQRQHSEQTPAGAGSSDLGAELRFAHDAPTRSAASGNSFVPHGDRIRDSPDPVVPSKAAAAAAASDWNTLPRRPKIHIRSSGFGRGRF